LCRMHAGRVRNVQDVQWKFAQKFAQDADRTVAPVRWD
jgi:hypothetical protein